MANTTLAAMCCEVRDPCEVACLLETAYVNRLLGQTVVSHQIGAEKYTIDLPAIGDIQRAKAHYEQLCQRAGGFVPNAMRRPRLCIEFGDHECCPPPRPACGDVIVGEC